MTLKLDYDQAVTLLKRAVLEKGSDYVYPNSAGDDECMYFDYETEAPSCIVGHVLSYKGVGICDVGGNNEGMAVDVLVRHGVLSCDLPTLRLLSSAQENQDKGNPWGVSVSHAINYVEAVTGTSDAS